MRKIMSREHVKQWIKLIAKDYQLYPEHRKGQRAFNTLCSLQPRLANEVRGTDIDPFYSDERLKVFIPWATKQLMAMLPNQTSWRNK